LGELDDLLVQNIGPGAADRRRSGKSRHRGGELAPCGEIRTKTGEARYLRGIAEANASEMDVQQS
jgi:hypothetical protein